MSGTSENVGEEISQTYSNTQTANVNTARVSSYTKKSPNAPAVVYKTSGTYVASKNGVKYYLPECSGVKRIKEENKIWFDTIEEAQAKGYSPAVNCKGL